jgi:hypothetical protein
MNGSDDLRDALDALDGVTVVEAPKPAEGPVRVWFRVEPDAILRVLPFLAEFVATNYCGHPFKLIVDDTGDGESIGVKGSLVMLLESDHRGDAARQDAHDLARAISGLPVKRRSLVDNDFAGLRDLLREELFRDVLLPEEIGAISRLLEEYDNQRALLAEHDGEEA